MSVGGWQRTEKDSFSLFNRLSESSHWKMGDTTGELFGRVEKVHQQRSLQWSAVPCTAQYQHRSESGSREMSAPSGLEQG